MTEEEQAEDIDWENLYDEIRSSEIQEIKLKFLDNGKKITQLDDKEQPYTQFRFNCSRLDTKKEYAITYITSSKRLMEALKTLKPLKGKSLKITKTGANFQTNYIVTPIK